MKVFVPITDEMLERGDLDGLLVPYRPGRTLISQSPTGTIRDQSSSRTSASPAETPISEAMPALSSSTYCAGPSLG